LGFCVLGLWIFADQDFNLSSAQNIIGLVFVAGGGGTAIFRYLKLKKTDQKMVR